MDLILDADIRICCTLPIVLLVIVSAFLRQNVLLILASDQKTPVKDLRHMQLVARGRTLLAQAAGLLDYSSFHSRRLFYTKEDVGALCNPPAQPGALQTIAAANQDPTAMLGMLKNQFAFIILNGGLAYLVSFLFSGFLVARIPFPLTYKFKPMLQRGIELPCLDVAYVSSLSWYFLILFGCTGILTLINHIIGQGADVGDINSAAATIGGMGGMAQQQQQQQPAGLPGMGVDVKALYQQAQDDIKIASHKCALSSVEKKLIDKWTATTRPSLLNDNQN